MKYVVLAAFVMACDSSGCGGPQDSVAQLEDPMTCKQCHPKHYDAWSGSMHAYASQDPVFIAMNKRGQRETGGALGSFCVQCHAPMAVALHPNDDYSAFDPMTRPATERGITCYFCHNIDSVKADHNNGNVLALDQTMRGGARNPADTPAHDSAFDDNVHGAKNKSMECGGCHDVTTPELATNGQNMVALERTFSEWKTTVFAHDDPAHLLPVTCSSCHMISSTDVIAEGPGLNVGSRNYGFHDHSLPAVDQALSDFTDGIPTQTDGVESILKGSINIIGPTPTDMSQPPGGLCLEPIGGGQITVRMDTIQIGHNFPSGAAQDRRAWMELIAYDASNTVLFSSGVVPDGMDPEDIHDDWVDCTNPTGFQCTGFWDRVTKPDGTPAHFFWDIANVDSHFLRPPVTFDSFSTMFDHSTTAKFPVPAVSNQVDHMTARILIRPLNYAMLNDLVASGDLDAAIVPKVKTLVAKGSVKTWTRATAVAATGCNP
jgi:hypothetical protein